MIVADVAALQCALCGKTYAPADVQYTCLFCGPVGTLDVLFDYDHLRRSVSRALPGAAVESMWRYRALLPLPDQALVPPLRVGTTPLYSAPRLAAEIGVSAAWVKDDGANPTGSLKDRASALVVVRARALGLGVVATASTGNAAAALAGMGAAMAMPVVILVPASAPEAKIAQLLVYGARVLLVEGTYDEAFDLCVDLCEAEGWYCRNTGMNPYTAEGKKTVSFEIAEGLGWDVPDAVIVSVGDGNIIAGVHKGFADLLKLGWIERIPKLIGVQAEGSSAIAQAWQQGISAAAMTPQPADTLADSISASFPRDRAKALRAVRQTGGAFVTVPDQEILRAIPAFARSTGVFAEPSSAIIYAGAQRALALGYIQPHERLLFLSTGTGLKDVRRAQQAVTGGVRVPVDLAAVRQALRAGA